MYLAAEYKGKTLSASIKNENINNMVETQKMKYISPIITEVRQIFFIFCGSFKYGGRKYKHEIPPNAVMLPSPVIKVFTKPLPKIGNILSNEKLL